MFQKNTNMLEGWDKDVMTNLNGYVSSKNFHKLKDS